MAISLQTRILSGIIILAALSCALVWFVVRPQYEQRILDEQLTIVQQIESYTVESLDKQITAWLTTTQGITLQLRDRPKEGEAFVRHTMILHPEIVRIRIHSPELPDELVSQNTLYTMGESQQGDSVLLPTNDSLLCVGWLQTKEGSLFITRATFFLNNVQFFATIWWDATQLYRLIHRMPFGSRYAVALLSNAAADSVGVPFYTTGEKIAAALQVARFETLSHEGQQWYGVGVPFPKVPLKLVVAVPVDVIREPVEELVRTSLISLAVLFLLLFVAGWVLSYQLNKPLRQLSKDVERLSTLDFSQPIRVSGMRDIQRIAETVEHMRQSLERYQRLNDERIILEEWKNKLCMMHSDELIAVADPEGIFIFRNARFEEFCTQLSPLVPLVSKQELLRSAVLTISNETFREEVSAEISVQSIIRELKVHASADGVQYYRMSDSTISKENHPLGSIVILRDLTNDRLVDKMKTA